MASSSSSITAHLEGDRLSNALASWETDGQETLKQILLAQTESDLTAASTIPVTSTIVSLLQAPVGIESVASLVVALTEGWEEERKEVLWDALVDAVAVLSEVADDSRDLKQDPSMEVDGQQPVPAGERGVQLLKSLLVG